jgi:hypothetical protein
MAESAKWIDEAKRALFGTPASAPGQRPAQNPDKGSKRDHDLLKNRKAAEQAQSAKTAKLRALRLAKESEDKARSLAEAGAGGKAKSARKRKAAPGEIKDLGVASDPALEEDRGS